VFLLSNFILAIAQLIDIILNIYMWIVIIRSLISWVNPDPYNPIVRTLYNITDPVFNRIQRIIPIRFGAIDITPMIVLLIIIFLKTFLVNSLYHIAGRL
jgi:YggT family protein